MSERHRKHRKHRKDRRTSSGISIYDIIKFALYLDCFAILVCALLMYADDDCEVEHSCPAPQSVNVIVISGGSGGSGHPSPSPDSIDGADHVSNFDKKKKSKKGDDDKDNDDDGDRLATITSPSTGGIVDPGFGPKFMNYLALFTNIIAVYAIYFFAYDGLVYKLLIFVTLLIGLVAGVRCFLTESFHALHNIPNFIGITLAILMISMIYTRKTKVGTIRCPVIELIGLRVNNDGEQVRRRPDKDEDNGKKDDKKREKSKNKSSNKKRKKDKNDRKKSNKKNGLWQVFAARDYSTINSGASVTSSSTSSSASASASSNASLAESRNPKRSKKSRSKSAMTNIINTMTTTTTTATGAKSSKKSRSKSHSRSKSTSRTKRSKSSKN